MNGERVLLRLFLSSAETYHLAPVYERLILEAARRKLSGATVLRGLFGFGARGMLRPSDFRMLSAAPVIVEFVDTGNRIADFLQTVVALEMRHGLATLERAAVVMYRKNGGDPHRSELSGQIVALSTIPQIKETENMRINETGVLLRIFIGESDTWKGQPLFEAIIHKAREAGLAGGTVLRGSMGFGANSVLHTNKVLVLSTDLPIVIEIVDSREKIETLLPALDDMVQEGMITMEEVRILAYRHNRADAAPSGPDF